MALVRTDYGLIYNDDGSLCATLLPEGGVAVEEETTNLESITNGRLTTLTPNGTTPPQINLITTKTPFGTEAWEVTFPTTLDTGYAGSRAQGGTIAFQRSLPYTFAVWIKGDITGMLIYYTGAHGIGRLDATGREWDGWKEYSLVYTFPDGSDTVADYLAIVATSSPAAGKKIYVSMAQVEQKPYRTSPCEGTRPPGALSYPITLGRAGTIAIKWIKHKRLESGYEMPFRVANNVFEANIRDNLVGINTLVVTDFTWNPFEEHSFVYTWDMDSDDIKQWLYLDGDLKATRTWAPPDPTAYSVLWVGCGGVGYSPFNGIIKDFLLRPYAVSPETVKTWNALDAPFFDPREQIDAAARPIYAPGVQIDETGAWGIANGVKQAGFGTDGKWIAGGGSVVADEDGQRFINKTTGEIVIDFQSQTGKGIFRGDLVSDKVRLSKFMGYKVESSPDFITTIDGVSLTGNYPSCAFQPNFSICVASLNGNQRAQAILLSAVRYLPFSSSGIVVDTNAGYKDLVSVCFDSAKFNYHFLIVESGDLSTPLIWTTANDTLTSISQIARFNADVCWGLRTDCDNTHIYGTYIYNPTTNSYGDLKLIKLNIATKNIVSTKTLVTGRHISSCIKYYNNYLYIGYSNYDTGQVYLLKADTSGNIITEPVAIPGFYIWNFDISIDPQTGLVNVVSNRPGVGFRHGLVDLNFNPIYKPSFKTGKAGQEISAISTCRTVNGIFVVGDVYGSSLENPSPLVSSSLIPISNEDVSIHDIFALMLP